MRRIANGITFCGSVAIALIAGCSSPTMPIITPPAPSFVDSTVAPNPIDHRIYADAGPRDAIDIEWNADTSGNTSGYMLYRSIGGSIGDSTVGTDGLLKNRTTIAQLESTNQAISPLPTSYLDTLGITSGATYYYQLQAYYRQPNNTLNFSKPTHVDRSTSFTYAKRIQLLSPFGTDTLHGFPETFRWQDPNNGGSYQIVVQRLTDGAYMWSAIVQDFEGMVAEQYPPTALPLQAGVPYQWRVKWLASFGGSSSTWLAFTVVP